jgi:NAD(P)-dependent dehydrogenase (short-subunit alcohol dehydrogenase family)
MRLNDPQSVSDIVTDLNPMNRYGSNQEIANIAQFLGSDESSYCNGSVYLTV